MSRVLVTGGGGFIGSHTCVSLLERNFEIVVIDSFINSHQKSLNRIYEIFKSNNKDVLPLKVIKCDIRQKEGLDSLFKQSKKEENPITAVFHFAGLKSVSESILNPLDYWDVNVGGTINLLKIMDKYNCRNIIFSSSASIYCLTKNGLIDESSRKNPNNPYGKTKLTVENILNNLYSKSPGKWRIACLRYFNPIGAHPSGLIGEEPKGIPSNIFPFITKVASKKLKELTIFGADWQTHDGTGIRDYIHIMDLAEGHIAALEYLLKNKAQIISFNLGTGKGTSVLELVKTFEKVNNISIPYKISNRREGDLPYVVANNSYAIKYLDWIPKRSLKEMCKDGWKWQKLNPNGYQ